MDTVNTRDIYSYFEYEGKMYKCPFDKFVLQISEIDENMAQKGNGLHKKRNKTVTNDSKNGAIFVALLLLILMGLCPPLGVLLFFIIIFSIWNSIYGGRLTTTAQFFKQQLRLSIIFLLANLSIYFALLMVSDIHPTKPDAPKWEWHMTRDMKYHLAEQGIALAKRLIKWNAAASVVEAASFVIILAHNQATIFVWATWVVRALCPKKLHKNRDHHKVGPFAIYV